MSDKPIPHEDYEPAHNCGDERPSELAPAMRDKCKHGVRNLETNLPYCRQCDSERKVSERGSVFEAVDCTSEESYYTMGIWPSLEATIAVLRKLGTDAPGEHNEDYCVVEIRERKIGILDWSETGKVRWKFAWEKTYESSDDGDGWRVKETPNK